MKPGWVAWVVVCCAGCESLPPESLDDVDFPPGYVLDSHVDVVLHVDDALAADDAFVSVYDADGLRFEGALDAVIDAGGLPLRMSPSVQALTVEIRSDAGVTRRTVVIEPSGDAWLAAGGE